MRDSWRHFTAEFIGTFALVFVGGASIMTAQLTGSTNGLMIAAMAHGLVLAVMVSALMRISGHFNPAVTLAFLAVKRIDPMMAMVYLLAQFLAAVLGAYALRYVYPEAVSVATHLGGQSVAAGISTGQAIVCEVLATFFLMFVVFGTAVDPSAPKVGGFGIGLVVSADILAFGPLTGASMNPARSFGPALVSGSLAGQSVYWIGPIIGAVAAAFLYDGLFLRRGKEPADHGELRA